MTNEKQNDTPLDLFTCEVASVVRMFRESGGDRVKNYLLQVEKARGSDASQRLRTAALEKLKEPA